MATNQAKSAIVVANSNPLSEFCPLYQLAVEQPDIFTVNRLRHMANNRHHNGAAKAGAILVVGGQLCAHRANMAKWLTSPKTKHHYS